MNNDEPRQESSHWFGWAVIFLVLLSAMVVLPKAARLTRRATVTVDTNGTTRLGGVLPLQNKTVRDVALTVVSRLNGRTASIAAADYTCISNVVETIGAMGKAGITSVVLHCYPAPAEQKER